MITLKIVRSRKIFNQFQPSGVTNAKKNHHSYVYPPEKTRRSPPPRDVAGSYKKLQRTVSTSVPSKTFPLLLLPLLLLLLSWSACGYYAARLDALRTLFPSLCSAACSQHPKSTHPLPPPLIFPQQSARDYVARLSPTNPNGGVRTAWRPYVLLATSADMISLASR